MKHMTYPLYPERSSLSLDGQWEFAWLDDIDARGFAPARHPTVFDEIAAVPGCFNLAGSRIGRRGVGLYRTTFTFPEGAAQLRFGGLGLYARVWLDGVDLGEIKNPYATITIDTVLGPRVNGRHELLVLVDNRFGNSDTVPVFKPYADFHGYGGIYRSVTISQLPERRIERVHVVTLDIATGRVRLDLRLNGPDQSYPVRIRYAFDEGESQDAEIVMTPGQRTVSVETHVPNHRVWSPESPNLHTLTLSIVGDAGDGAPVAIDTIVERFGLRTITTRGRELLLNGSPIRLFGLNRHESHPQLGPVQPDQIIVDDLHWAQELNANFIRTAHYQPDSPFLDACDRTGFLVWVESLGWAQPESDARNPETVALLRDAVAALVEESLNHPSAIIYGFLNESCSDTPAGRELYQTLAGTIRSLDDTRLVSYASNRFEADICFDLADIISINPYPGWIDDADPADDEERIRAWTATAMSRIRPEFDRLAEYFSSHPEHAQKPLLVSESGAAGIYGIRDRARAQWSEEFQQDYFDEAIRAVLDNPRYIGITLWQMFDCRSFVNAGPSLRTKPRGYNSAGLLDEYRRPKLVFDTVKSLFARYREKAD